MNAPILSVIIPGYNRLEPLKFTLRSAIQAGAKLSKPIEFILVDDGSEPPLARQLGDFVPADVLRHLRQPNQGSIIARQTGLHAAKGSYILFLDSDDLIHPDKLKLHLDVLETNGADVTYDDMATATLGEDYGTTYTPGNPLAVVNDSATLFLCVQPAPHGPIYRREYLTKALAAPLVPVSRRMDPAGDVWLYYNLLLHPARVEKVSAPLTAAGPHTDSRYSQHWEKLGAAALLIAEEFAARCPDRPENLAVRRLVAETAFRSWRRLPRDYHQGYSNRLLAVWLGLPHGSHAALGGRLFQALAMIVGASTAGRMLRRLNHDYASCRTLNDEELANLLQMPPSTP
jgi:glycosyltransferase involved in cell wall biosynthesis